MMVEVEVKLKEGVSESNLKLLTVLFDFLTKFHRIN